MKRIAKTSLAVALSGTLVLALQWSASATYTYQVAQIAPPGSIIDLDENAEHCRTAPEPDGGDLGCFYGDVGHGHDEVAFFEDSFADGYLVGVYWETKINSGLCAEYYDDFYDGRQWCDLPDMVEGRAVTVKVGTCPTTANCRPSSNWRWSSELHLHA